MSDHLVVSVQKEVADGNEEQTYSVLEEAMSRFLQIQLHDLQDPPPLQSQGNPCQAGVGGPCGGQFLPLQAQPGRNSFAETIVRPLSLLQRRVGRGDNDTVVGWDFTMTADHAHWYISSYMQVLLLIQFVVVCIPGTFLGAESTSDIVIMLLLSVHCNFRSSDSTSRLHDMTPCSSMEYDSRVYELPFSKVGWSLVERSKFADLLLLLLPNPE